MDEGELMRKLIYLILLLQIVIWADGGSIMYQDEEIIILNTDTVKLYGQGLNIRSTFNHYSNLDELKIEEKALIFDTTKDNYE